MINYQCPDAANVRFVSSFDGRYRLIEFLHSGYLSKINLSEAAKCMEKLRKRLKYEVFTPELAGKITAFRVPYFNVNAAGVAVSGSISYLQFIVNDEKSELFTASRVPYGK